MYGASEAEVKLENGAEFTLVQETEYPFDGKIRFTAKNVKEDRPVHLRLRVPGWAVSGSVKVRKVIEGKNAEEVSALTEKNSGTYLDIRVDSLEDLDVELNLTMEVRYTAANLMVEEAAGQAAIERGPLVYCCEGVDTAAESLDDIYLDLGAEFTTAEFEIEGRKMVALEAEEYVMDRSEFDRKALYQPLKYHGMKKEKVRLIPYYAWDNREFGEMRIWFPVAYTV